MRHPDRKRSCREGPRLSFGGLSNIAGVLRATALRMTGFVYNEWGFFFRQRTIDVSEKPGVWAARKTSPS